MINKYTITLAIIVVLGFIMTAIFRVLTPEELEIPEPSIVGANITGQSTNFSRPSFVGDEINIPPQMEVYLAQDILDEREILERLVEVFDLVPNNTPYRSWTGNTWTLSEAPPNQNFSLSRIGLHDLGELALESQLSDQELVERSIVFINSFFPDLELKPEANPRRITSLHETIESGPDDSVVALEISLSYKLTDINWPVFIGQNYRPPFEVLVLKNGQVMGTKFFLESPTFAPIGSKNTISIDQSLNNIDFGRASLITAGSREAVEIDLGELTNITLTVVELQYRLDTENSLLYPFFLFEGQGFDAGDNLLEVQIITPAISVN